jgi:hypothetical protein
LHVLFPYLIFLFEYPPANCCPPVIEPPKIIPYYRLSQSTWPLKNNKELLSRFRWVKPGKSNTTGSLICAKPTRRRDQSTTLLYIKASQVQDYYKPDFSYIKVNMIRVSTAEIKLAHDTHRRPSMHITHHHRSPIQALNHLG